MSSDLVIAPAEPGDEVVIFSLIQEMAEFERLSHQVVGSAALLGKHLFGAKPSVEGLVARLGSEVVGYALFFPTFSTFRTQPGIWLEDLLIREDYRGKGFGHALLTAVQDVAKARGCGRLEWSVLDWNESAIRFYESFGADILPDWRICRVMIGDPIPL